MKRQIQDSQQRQELLKWLLAGKNLLKTTRNTKSLPSSRFNNSAKKNKIWLNPNSKIMIQQPQLSARNLYSQKKTDKFQPRNQVRNIFRSLCKLEPKKVNVKLTDIIKSPQSGMTRRSQNFSQTVQLKSQHKIEKDLCKQIKVSVVELEKEILENKVEQARSEPLEYSFSKEYNKKSKTQSQFQETIVTSEFTSDLNESSQLKQTQKRSIQLYSSSPSTLISKKQKQLSEDPLDNLQILQKLINQRMQIEPSQQNQEQEVETQNQKTEILEQWNEHQFHKSLPALVNISPMSNDKLSNDQPKIETYKSFKPLDSSPKVNLRLQQQGQQGQQIKKKRSPFENKKINQNTKKNQTKYSWLSQRHRQIQKAKVLKENVLKQLQNSHSSRNQLDKNNFPEYKNTKQTLLEQIQNRPQINQSFLDPFEEISSVFGEMQKSNIIEESQNSAHDLQNLLILATNESMEVSILNLKEQKDLDNIF